MFRWVQNFLLFALKILIKDLSLNSTSLEYFSGSHDKPDCAPWKV